MKRVAFVLSLAAVVGLVAMATGFAAEGKGKGKEKESLPRTLWTRRSGPETSRRWLLR